MSNNLLSELQRLRDQAKEINSKKTNNVEMDEFAWYHDGVYQLAKNIDQTIEKIFNAYPELPRKIQQNYTHQIKPTRTDVITAAQLQQTQTMANMIVKMIEVTALN